MNKYDHTKEIKDPGNFRSRSDLELDDEWSTANERLTHFRKAREQVVGRTKGEEFPSVQRTQSSEEYLVVRERFPSRNERPSVR